MSSPKLRTLVIIPAYNEEGAIEAVISSVRNINTDLDILVVNDGSTDRTAEIASAQDVILLDLPVNLGIGGAMQAGFLYASRNGYDAVIQVDGDGQHDPSYIPELVEQLNHGSDIVVGSRFCVKNAEGSKSTVMRRFGIKFLSLVIYLLSKQRVTDPTSGLRAINRKVVRLFAQHYPQDYPEPESLLTAHRHGFLIKEVPVTMYDRHWGRSSITAVKSIYYIIKVTLAMCVGVLIPGLGSERR
jgi:glycosyltransferase involved in cell wall biosynthesis